MAVAGVAVPGVWAPNAKLLRLAVTGVVAASLALVVIYLFRPLSQDGTLLVGDTSGAVASLLSAVLCFVLAQRKATEHRRAWLLIGIGSALYTVGEWIWLRDTVILGENPFPSWADVAYLCATPFLAAGFFSFGSQWGRLGWARVTVNGMIVFLLTAALTWHFILLPMYKDAGTPLLEKALSMAYPITDVGLLAAAALSMRGLATRRVRLTLLVIVASLISTTIADIGLSAAELTTGYESGSVTDVFWPISHLLLALATAVYVCTPRESSSVRAVDRITTWSAQGVPMVANIVMIAVLVLADLYGEFARDWPFVLMLLAVGVMSVVRQAVTQLDVARLNHELADARDNLEHRVLLRTSQLRDSEARFSSFADSAAEGIVSVNQFGSITMWNAGASGIFGRPAEEILGRSFVALLAPHEQAALARDTRPGDTPLGKLAGKQSIQLDAVRANGEAFPVELSVAAWENGVEQHYGIIVRDIGDRRRVELARERLAEIVSATTDIVISVDMEGSVIEANESARRVFAIKTGPRSMVVSDYVPEWARQVLVEQAVPAAIRDGSWSGESAFLTAAGEEVPVSLVVIAHRGASGTLHYFSAIARDITERKRQEAQLQRLAHFDPATGLLNRRSFETALSAAAASAGGGKGNGAVLFIDLDRFKAINDNFGHHTGDDLLSSIARRLRSAFDERQLVARLHGDEFAVLIPGATAEDAENAARWLTGVIRDHVVVARGQRLNVTASIGVALYPDHGSTAEELLVRADYAMYRAKELRDRYCVFSPAMESVTLTGKVPWEQRIREALRDDRFVLYFQPIQSLRDERVHYEALLRMKEDDGTVIQPTAFLEVAERSGLIHAIDRWVARQAIRTIAEYEAAGIVLCLEVNLSGKAFGDPTLLDEIQREIKATGINAGQLVFEVTETSAIADLDEARRFISRLREFGCRFALDDFGTGFSSLWMLKQLPVDYLKIDGSFIRNLEHDLADQEMVKAISQMARALGKQTIAEFVTTAATMELLTRYGVDFGQGYQIGEPEPSPAGLPIPLAPARAA